MFSWFSAIISPDQGMYLKEKLGFDFSEYMDFLTRYSFTILPREKSFGHWRRTNVQMSPQPLNKETKYSVVKRIFFLQQINFKWL